MVSKMTRMIIFGIVTVIVIIVIMVLVFAVKWKNSSNYNSIFDGPTDSNLSNLVINIFCIL